MANPVQHAQSLHDDYHAEVKTYMPDVFSRLFTNYGLLGFGLIVVSAIIAPASTNFIPVYLANSLGFALNLLWLYFGWRFLERRNQATPLFVLYTRYSRYRRDLEALLKTGETGDALYTAADLLEESAKNFLSAAQEAGVKKQA